MLTAKVLKKTKRVGMMAYTKAGGLASPPEAMGALCLLAQPARFMPGGCGTADIRWGMTLSSDPRLF
jgi:hypothetical protein